MKMTIWVNQEVPSVPASSASAFSVLIIIEPPPYQHKQSLS